MERLDVLIVGAGPIGLCCAIESQQRGLSYLVIEKGTSVNSLFNYPLNMQFFSTADKLEISGVPFISTGAKPGRKDALEYYGGIERSRSLKINHYEKVEGIIKMDGYFDVQTSKGLYEARHVIVATGFYDIPNPMAVKGEELEKVSHYYKEPYPYTRQNVVVIGASNSAVDVALETYRKGANVTLIVRGSEISSSVKYWVKPDIENRIKEGSIDAYFNSTVLEIKEQSLVFETAQGEQKEIPNDFVLAMTGYLPDFEFLKAIGIELEGPNLNPFYNPLTMETNVENLYLAGVVCGGKDTHLWFIENSRNHADIILRTIAKRLEP